MKDFQTYTSFTTNNLDEIKDFYEDKVGVKVAADARPQMVMFSSGGSRFMIYNKQDHKPADYTVLNFAVEKIESVVKDLSSRGIVFEKLEGTNDQGIAEISSVKVAWFKDPSGNWIGLSQGI